jgi:hypothetical protein
MFAEWRPSASIIAKSLGIAHIPPNTPYSLGREVVATPSREDLGHRAQIQCDKHRSALPAMWERPNRDGCDSRRIGGALPAARPEVVEARDGGPARPDKLQGCLDCGHVIGAVNPKELRAMVERAGGDELRTALDRAGPSRE